MQEKLIKYTVYILTLLLFFCLVFFVYGVYLKLNIKSTDNQDYLQNIELLLTINQEIKDIEAMDSNKILITIFDKDKGIQGIVYDTSNNRIIYKITK